MIGITGGGQLPVSGTVTSILFHKYVNYRETAKTMENREEPRASARAVLREGEILLPAAPRGLKSAAPRGEPIKATLTEHQQSSRELM